MASIRLQPKTNSILHSNYGNQPFRPLALEGNSSSDDGEISNIDGEIDLPSIEEILARAKSRQPHASLSKCMIDLTGQSDDIAISLCRKLTHFRQAAPSLSTRFLQPLSTSLSSEPIHTACDFRVLASMAASSAGKKPLGKISSLVTIAPQILASNSLAFLRTSP